MPERRPLHTLAEFARKETLLLVLLAVLIVFTASRPDRLALYPALVDWHTVATLAGLMILTKGVELSGYLHRWGRDLIEAMRTQRRLALFLVAATALLAMMLTNDVALFVMVPLTLGLRAAVRIPMNRMIVFEALAANAGAVLTPIGNPQNLFLWKLSHVSFARFVFEMLPLAAILLLALALLTLLSFPGLAIAVRKNPRGAPAPQRGLLLLSAGLYAAPFLILADLNLTLPAILLVAGVFLARHREILAKVDWALILVFVCMFIDLRLLARMDWVKSLVESIGLERAGRLYLTGIISSQLISNVPAAILLAEYTRDWRLIAYSVNVGGFGFALGSLANLIALRLARERRAWLVFHAYALPFMLAAGSLVYLLVVGRGN